MPQPDGVAELADDLVNLYLDAWTRIQTAEQRLIDSWPTSTRAKRREQLRALQTLVETLTQSVDEQALRWTSTTLPRAFLLGAVAVEIGGLAGLPLDALTVIAQDTYRDLLTATDGVTQSAKALIRELGKGSVTDKVLTGDTAVQAGADLAEQLAGQGITSVVYANGRRTGLAEYTEMLLRTKTATAYSTGNLTAIGAAGVGWVEVFDGFGCGWIGHDDSDKANGTVRSVDEAMTAVISHPRCQRSFGGRPDITSAHAADAAEPSTTARQRLDQATVDLSKELAAAQKQVARSLTGQTAGKRVVTAEGVAVSPRQATRLSSRTRPARKRPGGH